MNRNHFYAATDNVGLRNYQHNSVDSTIHYDKQIWKQFGENNHLFLHMGHIPWNITSIIIVEVILQLYEIHEKRTWQRKIKGSLHFLQVISAGAHKFLRSNHAGLPPTLLGKNLGCKSQLGFSSKTPISMVFSVIM